MTTDVVPTEAEVPKRRSLSRFAFPLRFSLASLLLLMIPLGVACVWLRNYLDYRPLDWVAYSAVTLDHDLHEKRTVLVNFTAEWDPNSSWCERHAVDPPTVRKLIRARRIVPMRTDFTAGSPEIRAALH